ncbi:caspase family protein [Verrucomicrobium sp. BvORR106]|uniref:caspase family protein n=1 Tax=Verrucomicrobium sp. BvORR106 TaxID=1403819 RepID=UPI00056F05E9|nr:caspase family protein [Verrucomicrobium sp. BvORR106]
MNVLWIHGEGRNPRQLASWQQWHQVLQDELEQWHPGTQATGTDFPLTAWRTAVAALDANDRRQAIAQLAQGQVIRGMGDLLRGNQVVSAAAEQIADCAALISVWTSNAQLRRQMSDELAAALAAQTSAGPLPLLVIAPGVGSLAAYDCLLSNPHLAQKCLLVTPGSPLGHPIVRNVYGGRMLPVGSSRWYHLHNPHDRTFASTPGLRDEAFVEVLTPFVSADGSLNHEVIAAGSDRHGYLDHPAAREWLWPDVLRYAGRLPSIPHRNQRPRRRSRTSLQASKAENSVFQPTHRALLIGIDRYQHASIPELKGCVNDTYLMSSVLQECGMAPEQIRMLHNERATASAIRERLDWLLDGAAAGDSRVLFFSGHGAQLESYSTGEVVDRQDECLVAHDFTFSRDSAIVDDDLWRLYSQLPYEADFIAILDCCHAGGAHRGPQRVRGIEAPGDIRHRGMQWNAGLKIWEERPLTPVLRAAHAVGPKTRTMQAAEKARYFGKSGTLRKIGRANVLRQVDDASYDTLREELGHKGPYLPLLLQACEEAELAAEYDHGSVAHGAFTYCTAQSLRELGAGGKAVTFERLLLETRKRMKLLGFAQTPVLLGPRRKTSRAIPLLGRETPPEKPSKPSARHGWKPEEKASSNFAQSLGIYPVTQNLPAARPAHLTRPPKRTPTPSSVAPPAATRDVMDPGNDRRQAKNTEFSPWNAVSYLEATFENGKTFRGSGFCVGRRLLVTAGHCLLEEGNRAVSINVFPGLQDGRTVIPASTSTTYVVHPEWASRQSPEHDYGLILLNFDAPWMGTAVLSDQQLNGLICFVAGYPIDLSLQVWAAAGFIGPAGSAMLNHRIDSEDGQSGGPILHVTNSLDTFAVGIHTQGTPGLNHGVRLTPDVLGQIIEWAKAWETPIP